MARPGSTHGYDVIDFNRLNPELGDEAEFDALIAELHANDMGLLLDFVPNHMGVGSDNPWWLDVLEWGRLSPYAAFFDIDWEASARGVRGKITLPVLGDQYGKVLEAGDLKPQFDGAEGTFHVAYHDQRFPIALREYPQLLRSTASLLDRDGAALFQLAEKFAALADDTSTEQPAVRRQEAFVLKAALAEAAREPGVRAALDAAVAALNGTPGPARDLPAPARAPRGSGVSARVLARRQLRDQLPPLLRHQSAGRAAHGVTARCSRRRIGCCCA